MKLIEFERTTADDLQDIVKSIALDITNGLTDSEPDEFQRWHDEGEPEDFTPSGYDYLDDVYDIEYIIDVNGNYRGAELMVAGGGPNIYVETRDNTVRGYWGGDKAQWHYVDNIGLDDACEELYQCTR
tara:strand:+ start:11 stop:394 length:384 start_codon:yes stop_codon:yes gene_type:complete